MIIRVIMKTGNDDIEYMEIVSEILKNREFNKLKDFTHHKTTRMEHSKRVAYLSYRICKKLNLDYVSAARGGMLHDFFLNRYTAKNTNKLIRNHPKIASTNAKKHFNLNKKEINIIESHMFPLAVKIKPKYKESYVVAFADKLVWGYEKFVRYCKEISFELGKSYIYLSRDI